MKASIILCVYNGEKTIKECIHSILQQTNPNFELLIINDGSIDHTFDIISSYSDSRIRVINQENHGLSYSRNIGLKNAKGEYILFVDADDTVSKYLLEEVFQNISDNELLLFSYMECHNFLYKRKIIHSQYPNKDNISEYGYVWNKVYKKEIIDRYRIKFSNRIQLVEDLNFNKKYLMHIKKIGFLKQVLYYYNRKDKRALSRKHYDNFLKMKELNIKDKLEIVGYDSQYEKHLYLQLIKHYLISCIRNKQDIDMNKIYFKYNDKIQDINNLSLEEKTFLYLLKKRYYRLLIFIVKIIIMFYDFI